MNEDSDCFKICNDNFTSLDPRRTYCKKGCKSDFEKEECKKQTCDDLCIKKELGEEGSSWGCKFFIKHGANIFQEHLQIVVIVSKLAL